MFNTFCTSGSNVANVTWRTRALDNVIVNRALKLSAARIGLAWIFATTVDASFVCRTIGIASTTEKRTRNSRITGVSWWTLAHGLMIDTVAFGVFGARRENRRTSGDTRVLDAGVSIAALPIRSTSGNCKKLELNFFLFYSSLDNSKFFLDNFNAIKVWVFSNFNSFLNSFLNLKNRSI